MNVWDQMFLSISNLNTVSDFSATSVMLQLHASTCQHILLWVCMGLRKPSDAKASVRIVAELGYARSVGDYNDISKK